MTVHRDFVITACPGDYLYSRMSDIASKVNAKLGQSSAPATATPNVTIDTPKTIKGTVLIIYSPLPIRS